MSRCQGMGARDAGQEREQGNGEQPGGPGDDIVHGRSHPGMFGRRGSHGGGGQRCHRDGQPDGEHQDGGKDVGQVVGAVGGLHQEDQPTSHHYRAD